VVLISYAQYTSEERARIGIKEGLIRLSVGVLESCEELIDDLEAALDRVLGAGIIVTRDGFRREEQSIAREFTLRNEGGAA
jgi:hypothetical protein